MRLKTRFDELTFTVETITFDFCHTKPLSSFDALFSGHGNIVYASSKPVRPNGSMGATCL